jgi:hypothetical protein
MLRAALRKLAAAAGTRARALGASYDGALQARPRLVKALTAAAIGERARRASERAARDVQAMTHC